MPDGIDSYVTKDGRRLWRIRYDAGPDPATGRRRRVTVRGFESEGEAVKKRRELLVTVDRNQHVDRSDITVREYLTSWLAGIRVAENTLLQYRQAAEVYAIPRIGGRRLQHLTAEHVDALYRELEREGKRDGTGLAAKSVRHVHTMIRKALQDAVERGRVARNVADLANPPTAKQARSKSARDRVWSGEQIRVFLEAAEGELLHPLYFLVCTTGLRRHEACDLDLGDVDLDAATVRVRDAKTDAGQRTIGLDGETVRVLRDWLRQRRELQLMAAPGRWHDSGRFFTDERGAPIKPGRVYQRLLTIAERAELPRITVHALRHSYATAALRAGVPVKVVSDRLGHADAGITYRVYAHAMANDDHAAAEITAAAILGGSI